MNRWFIAIFFILLGGNIYARPSKCDPDIKIFNIQSLDGKAQKIFVIYDLASNLLTISCLQDTINVNEFMDLRKVVMFNKNFIAISYEIRSGSDQDAENMLIICVKRNKLYAAMNIESLSTYDVEQVFDKRADSLKLFDEHGDYHVKVSLTGNSEKNYKLNVSIHDEVRSKHEPLTSHNYYQNTLLNFDTDKLVFFSVYENIDSNFDVYAAPIFKQTKQHISSRIPVIALADADYYFINDRWFGLGQNKVLSTEIHRGHLVPNSD